MKHLKHAIARYAPITIDQYPVILKVVDRLPYKMTVITFCKDHHAFFGLA
jgi:hypothetical protein